MGKPQTRLVTPGRGAIKGQDATFRPGASRRGRRSGPHRHKALRPPVRENHRPIPGAGIRPSQPAKFHRRWQWISVHELQEFAQSESPIVSPPGTKFGPGFRATRPVPPAGGFGHPFVAPQQAQRHPARIGQRRGNAALICATSSLSAFGIAGGSLRAVRTAHGLAACDVADGLQQFGKPFALTAPPWARPARRGRAPAGVRPPSAVALAPRQSGSGTAPRGR
jgi:hypothetical protein